MSSATQALREARSRLVKAARGAQGTGRSQDTGVRLSETATESLAILRGLNTVGVLVTAILLIFLLASAQASRQKLQQRPDNPYRQPPNFDPNLPSYAVKTSASMDNMANSESQGEYNSESGNKAEGRAVEEPKLEKECCSCDGTNRKLSDKAGNISEAAATLGGLLWLASHVPQVLKVRRSGDASSFSFLNLFAQIGSSLLFTLYALAVGSSGFAFLCTSNCIVTGYYLWMHSKAPSPSWTIAQSNETEPLPANLDDDL